MKAVLFSTILFLTLGSFSEVVSWQTTGTATAAASQKRVEAERAWRSFYPKFLAALKRRDRAKLRGMMAEKFWSSFEGNLDRDEAFDYYDQARGSAWKALDRVLARGVTRIESTTMLADGQTVVLGRIAPPAAKKDSYLDWRAYFEYGEEGRWLWVGFIAGD